MDTSAGPYKNYTVVFLGSDNGHVLKILASTEGANASFGTQLLEDIDVYNPNKLDTPFYFRLFIFFLNCLSSFSLSVLRLVFFFVLHLVSLFHFLCSFASLLLSVFCLDLSCPPTLWYIVTLCITLYS